MKFLRGLDEAEVVASLLPANPLPEEGVVN
jgi:hypothetical protein